MELLQDEYHDGTVRRFSQIDFEFHLEPKLQAAIFRDNGNYYKRRGRLSKAISSYNEALDKNPECYTSKYETSRCHMDKGCPDLALVNADKCIDEHPDRIEIKHLRNACLFDLNDFEKSMVEYVNTGAAYPKRSQNDQRDTVRMVIQNTISDEQGACLLKNRSDILKYDKFRNSQQIDKRPMWKVLKEQGVCDVISVLEEQKLEVSKLKNLQNIRKQFNLLTFYFGLKTATDFDFLEKLQNDKRLFLGHTTEFNNKCRETISSALNELHTYENMLHARKPLYAAQYNSKTKEGKTCTEKSLFRIQLKTREETFAHLVRIKRFAATNKLSELGKYVEDISFNYFETKTKRVLPRKFEFISEIFNIVGIAYLHDVTKVSSNVFNHPDTEQLYELFQVPHLKKVNDVVVLEVREIFGNKHSYVDPEEPDHAYIKYKKRVSILEKELRHCRHAVQSCYINFTLCQVHIAQGQMDEPKILASRIVDMAEECNNMPWKMLGYITCIRAELLVGQLVTCRRYMDHMYRLRNNFDEFIRHFITTAILLHKKCSLSGV